MSGRLARYALFQASDYVRERGFPLLLVGALLLLMAIQGAIGSAGMDLGGGELRTLATATVFLELFAPTAVLIAVNGIISGDRKHHYYRLLFSKPISAPRYYAQAFLVSLFGTLVATLLVLVAFGAIVGAIPIWGALHFVLLYFLLFGGVGFLLSAITEYDWIALGVVWSLAWLLRSWFPADGSAFGSVVDVLLPPLQLLAGAAAPLLGGAGIDTHSRLWVVAYGVAAFAAGLLVVRYRPMAS
jgi:ABC-type transport system involved in multi-copper enzyme maturation permease subunit